jgi:fimbrial isopeptide formation D2 family protein/uncharacterized repeat protein (TIGR01451 family)
MNYLMVLDCKNQYQNQFQITLPRVSNRFCQGTNIFLNVVKLTMQFIHYFTAIARSKLRQTQAITSFFILLTALGGTNIVRAEGSKQLVSQGGNRPYLEWASGTTANIVRKTLLKVYVKQGEIVNLGSSVHTSFDSQDIVYRSPFGRQNGVCDVLSTGYGFIDTLAKETAGPLPNLGGYTPCSFVATETGIYEVEFHAPNLTGNPAIRTTTATFPTDNTQGSGVAAWDITVRDILGNPKNGRVFTNYVAMNLGGNGIPLNSDFFIQTKDGYRYRTDMNGVDPFGFIFFANSRGYIDKTDNSTLYRTAKADNNALSPFQGNVEVQRPDLPDTVTDITHLIFTNRPDPEALIHLGIPTSPVIPAVPTNFKFTGGTGGSGNQTPVGVGGNFSFDVSSSGSYQIIIDTNTDGVFDPSVDRVLQNVANAGSNVVFWDGKNAAGTNLPPRSGNAPYNAQITLRAGEYHFPMLDAENNPNGFVIEMENAPGAFPAGKNKYTIYYNDTNYTTKNGTFVSLDGTGATNPRNAATGIDSSAGRHQFSSNYGDFKGIDTWAFFPSQAVLSNLVITTTNQANVRGRKSVRFLTDADGSGTVTVGDRVEYTITYSNLSPGNTSAINFVINDTLPPQLTFINAAIVSKTTGNNITLNSSYSGAGALTTLVTGTTASNSSTLRVGDTITIRIIAEINSMNSGNPISNQATATFSTADNPSATLGTVLTDADSNGATTNPPAPGSYFFQTADDGINTGNDPTSTSDDDPTVFTVVSPPPNLRLVKRITALNGINLTGFVDYINPSDPRALNDNAPNWPLPKDTYLRGAFNNLSVKPGDEVEYTIYFLSDGGRNSTNVQVCDLIPANTTFIPNAFNNQAPANSSDYGIALGLSATNLPTAPTNYVTNAADADQGRFYAAGTTPPLSCSGSNNNGAIVVDVAKSPATLPRAIAPGNPTNSYGFIRFRVRVN